MRRNGSADCEFYVMLLKYAVLLFVNVMQSRSACASCSTASESIAPPTSWWERAISPEPRCSRSPRSPNINSPDPQQPSATVTPGNNFLTFSS